MTPGALRDRITVYELTYTADGRSTTRTRGAALLTRVPCRVEHKAPSRDDYAGGDAVRWPVKVTLRYQPGILGRTGVEIVWHREGGGVTLEIIGPRTLPDAGPPRWMELHCTQTEGP